MRKEKLSNLCKISNGFAFKSDDYVSHGHRVMRITNVQKGLVVDNDPKFIPNKIADKVNNFKLNVGDILVSLTGNVGRVGRVLSQHLPAVLNQRVGLIRPTSTENQRQISIPVSKFQQIRTRSNSKLQRGSSAEFEFKMD